MIEENNTSKKSQGATVVILSLLGGGVAGALGGATLASKKALDYVKANLPANCNVTIWDAALNYGPIFCNMGNGTITENKTLSSEAQQYSLPYFFKVFLPALSLTPLLAYGIYLVYRRRQQPDVPVEIRES